MKMTIAKTLAAAGCVVALLAAAHAAQQTPPGNTNTRVTPGDLVVDPPTLINLGFEWVDRRRRQSQRRRSTCRTARSARRRGRRGCRSCGCRASGSRSRTCSTWSCRTCSPAASSTSSPDTAYEARFVLTDPDGIGGPAANATKTVTVRTRPEPMPADGRQGLSRLSGRLHRAADRAVVHRHHVRLQLLLRRRRHRAGRTAARQAGRHHPRPRRHLRVSATEYYANQTTINATTTFEGTYYLTADGTPERPIVIKAAGDGEVILDGRGNFNLFNVKAADYNYFEGHHLQEHRHRHLGRHAVHRRLEGADGQALQVRPGRPRRVLQLLGLEQLLHRRQHVPRTRTIRSISSAGTARSGSSSRAWTDRSFRRS